MLELESISLAYIHIRNKIHIILLYYNIEMRPVLLWKFLEHREFGMF